MLQAARILPVMCGPAYSPDRGAPGRARHPLGADVAMGGVRAHPRDQLECLIRYTARGAVALERLAEDANGDLVYSFTKPWADGTTGVKLSPLELLKRLVAIVPLPRVHLVRYAGCLAPHSQLRGAIMPTPRQQGIGEDEANTGTPRWN